MGLVVEGHVVEGLVLPPVRAVQLQQPQQPLQLRDLPVAPSLTVRCVHVPHRDRPPTLHRISVCGELRPVARRVRLLHERWAEFGGVVSRNLGSPTRVIRVEGSEALEAQEAVQQVTQEAVQQVTQHVRRAGVWELVSWDFQTLTQVMDVGGSEALEAQQAAREPARETVQQAAA